MLRIFIALLIFIFSCTESVQDIRLSDTEGKTVTLGEFRGKPLVVYVWSGTCIGHTEDMRELNKLYPRIKEKAELISIAIMMNAEDVRVYLRKTNLRLNYPIYADEKGVFAEKVALVFLPATVLFDSDGKLIDIYPGLPENLLSLIPSHR